MIIKKTIFVRYSENVEELYFLSIGGNMMDYPTWKKKPLPQQFNNFNKAYRLNALTKNEDQKQVSTKINKIKLNYYFFMFLGIFNTIVKFE